MRFRRSVTLLLTLVGGYVAICLLMWLLQDRLVFPGAGRGDRGVPPTSPPAAVAWLGEPGARTRLATLAPAKPVAVALYFGGNGEDLSAACATAQSLSAHGAEAIAVEYPGFGASDGRPTRDGLLATARAAFAHARARATALGAPLVVVGSSLGSFCAVHVAANGGVDRLVLRAPPTSLAAVAQPHYPWLPLGLLLAHRFDNLAAAPRVACPALIVHGTADTVVPERYGRELAAALPNAQFVPVPGFGHNDLDLSPSGPVGAVVRGFAFAR